MPWRLLHGRARRPSITPALWSQALGYCRYAARLPAAERRELRALAEAFIRAKSFDGAAGFEVTPLVRTVIALKACVPVLNAHTLGQLIDLYQRATVYAGLLYGVNPLDQPAVESGKRLAVQHLQGR